MKKIMFKDSFNLTQDVLKGRKTMTRRLVGERMTEYDIKAYLKGNTELANKCAKYKIGEVVAVAQSYKSVYDEMFNGDYGNSMYDAFRYAVVANTKGWNNKMYIRPSLMPHQIRITGVKVERLQDISIVDLEREGVEVRKYEKSGNEYVFYHPNPYGNRNSGYVHFYSLQAAARAFFNSIMGKYRVIDNPYEDMWKDNQWMFAYSFELVR